jgi:hypothetical protein
MSLLRKLMAPVEVKLVLSAFSEEMRRLEESMRRLEDPQACLGAGLGAKLIAPPSEGKCFPLGQ